MPLAPPTSNRYRRASAVSQVPKRLDDLHLFSETDRKNLNHRSVMKTWISQTPLVAVLGAFISLPAVFGAEADNSTAQPAGEPLATPVTVVTEPAAQPPSALVSATAATTPASDANTKLPYGVDEILKLSRARMNDDVTLNY